MMTDDFPDRGEAGSDASVFLEWIDEMAQSEGKTRKELIETLVSSYWTLDEMFRMMKEADPDAEISLPPELNLPIADSGSRTEAASAEFTARLEQLEDRIGEVEGDDDDSVPDLDMVLEGLESLRERVDELEADLGDLDDTPDEVVESLQQRVSELESLVSDQSSLRNRVDTEFRNLRSILEFLITTSDEIEGRTSQIQEQYDELAEFRSTLDRLGEIKHLADRLEVRTAKCDACGKTVDIALLPSPHCPQCDRTFDSVRPKQGWFGSPKLTIANTEQDT